MWVWYQQTYGFNGPMGWRICVIDWNPEPIRNPSESVWLVPGTADFNAPTGAQKQQSESESDTIHAIESAIKSDRLS